MRGGLSKKEYMMRNKHGRVPVEESDEVKRKREQVLDGVHDRKTE